MNIYLDDDVAKLALATRLQMAGHQVVLPTDVGLSGAWDPGHLLHAVKQSLVLVSKNHDDFKELHLLIQEAHGRHPGILIIRADNDPSRDMKDADIVRAIRNLELAGVPVANEFHILNHWR
jgi:predicted nuclease of predicted toxin-antitoxin system